MPRDVMTVVAVLVISAAAQAQASLSLEMEQITSGPKHHFFGYIGQSKTIPWNASGRYLLTLRTDFHDRMPAPGEPAEICLIDTENNFEVMPIETTGAWNFQQGAMFYWNPNAPETQFFFNDRKPETNHVFTVLYDIEQRRRVREYYFPETPVGNGGVSPRGNYFAAINYGRMARERPVTGYPGAFDWAADEQAPDSDGVFVVNLESGRKRLLISFAEMAERVRMDRPDIDDAGLYINHTLWNRPGDMLYFFLRGRIDPKTIAVNIPCTINADGSGFTVHETFIGGHPEWGEGYEIIGRHRADQVVYNVEQQEIVRTLGNRRIFPDPEGDIALSPDGEWLVNGSKYRSGRMQYDFLHLESGTHLRSDEVSRGELLHGDLRIDPAPRWNRHSNAVLVPSWTDDDTRQLVIIRITGE